MEIIGKQDPSAKMSKTSADSYNWQTGTRIGYPVNTTSVTITPQGSSIDMGGQYDFGLTQYNSYAEVLKELIKIRNQKRDTYVAEQKEYKEVLNQKEEIMIQIKKLSFAMTALNEAALQIHKDIVQKYDDEVNPPSVDLKELKDLAGDTAKHYKLKFNDKD